MLIIKNTYDDRTITVVSRETGSGRDVDAVALGVGQGTSVEFDEDHQIVLTSRPREPGEQPLREPRFRSLDDEGKTDDDKPVLTDAPEDTVRGLVKAMVDSGENLTKGGFPELPVLNAKLKDLGFNPATAAQRDAAMSA